MFRSIQLASGTAILAFAQPAICKQELKKTKTKNSIYLIRNPNLTPKENARGIDLSKVVNP